MTKLDVIHRHGDSLSISADAVEIARYVYEPRTPAVEARKPYLHPIRTLRGALVTAFRPWDHPWHKGIQMTWSNISNQNFWGGYSYVHGRGYIYQDNVGAMEHRGFESIDVSHDQVVVTERLDWTTAAGPIWCEETRTWRFHRFDAEASAWTLGFEAQITNVSGATRLLSSPTAEGREDAGYTGFFWRGPRSFSGCELLTQKGTDAAATMGSGSSEWIAVDGRFDETDEHAMVIFEKGTTSHGELNWFVRTDTYACVNPSPAFHERVPFEDGATLSLNHSVTFVDGGWDRERIEAYLLKAGS